MKKIWNLFVKWAVELYDLHNVIVRINKTKNGGGSGGYRNRCRKEQVACRPCLVSGQTFL